MAFTFQENRDVAFIRDEKLLKKAEENYPNIIKSEISPVGVVNLIDDDSKLNGIGICDSEMKLEKLSDYTFGKGESLILDFGDHYVGRFSINIDYVGSPMDAPLHLRLKFAEIPAELAVESSEYEGWLSSSWIQEEFVHIDELPVRLELPRRYSFRFVELKVMDTSPKWKACFSAARLLAESSACLDDLAELKIKDDTLQKIYNVGLKTLADCMQDVFEDGPKRDRRLWLGDLRLQALVNYETFDNKELVKRCLYLFAAMKAEDGRIPANVFVHPKCLPDDTFLFDYSLFFISVLYDYLKVHPEKELLGDLYPACKMQMDLALTLVDENGKFTCKEDYPVFVDWSNEFDKSTAATAEVIYALKQFIALAKEMEDLDIKGYEEKLENLTNYAKNKLFDNEKKLFVAKAGEINIASQVWMVLAKVMTDEENKEIMTQAVNELFPVKGIATPYMYHHVVEALFEAGLAEEAIKLMKEYWGKMVSLGADTFWEAFNPENPNYSPYGKPIINSYCHAWSCTPVYLIKKYCKDLY